MCRIVVARSNSLAQSHQLEVAPSLILPSSALSATDLRRRE